MLRSIKTEAEYDAALARVYELLQSTDAQEIDELDSLSVLLMSYESVHYPLRDSTRCPAYL